MPAYWIARSRITDPATYKKYTDRVPAILARYEGKVLARGGTYRVMAGPENFQRFVVIEFPAFERAVSCFESPEYQEASVFRDAGGVVETVIVEGGEPTPR
jgi:uncharacterized protein (DUF1330 family)